MISIVNEYKAVITNPKEIVHMNRVDDKGFVKVVKDSKIENIKIDNNICWIQELSESPDGKYIIAYCHWILDDYESIAPDRYHYYVMKKEDDIDNCSSLTIIGYFEDPDDMCMQWFTQGFEWYQEQGFVKMIVKNISGLEYKNKRVYYECCK